MTKMMMTPTRGGRKRKKKEKEQQELSSGINKAKDFVSNDIAPHILYRAQEQKSAKNHKNSLIVTYSIPKQSISPMLLDYLFAWDATVTVVPGAT